MRFAGIVMIILFLCGSIVCAQDNSLDTGSGRLIEVKVNGLVCDFCARALEKIFSKQPQVHIKKIDLTTKILTLELKSGASLDDETIKELVKKAGYVIEEIKRNPKENK